tara:strand:- start:1 stop:732 length:732 start_codon:yes stop_codon:yes gene_type:complete
MEKIKKTKLILFFFNKMAPKTLDGSAFSFTTTRGHTTHISILWVFVLFAFLVVAVVSLGGLQKGLVERQFPDTKVHGNLEVTDNFLSKNFLAGIKEIDSTVQTAAFTAEYGRLYLLGDPDPDPDIVITLPAPREGLAIRFVNVVQLSLGDSWTFGTAANPNFSPASFVTIKPTSDNGPAGLVTNGAHNVFTLESANNGGGGLGSYIDLVGVKTAAGVDQWLLQGFLAAQGDGLAAESSSFSAV